MKHLLYEHQNNIAELKADSTVALKLAQDEHRDNEHDLRKDKRGLKVELKEQELSHEDVIKNLKKVSLTFQYFSLLQAIGHALTFLANVLTFQKTVRTIIY